MTADRFLDARTLGIFALGLFAFGIATVRESSLERSCTMLPEAR